MHVGPKVSAVAASRPTLAARPAAPAPQVKIKARLEPLPKFDNAEQYKIYAIRLVSEAVVAQNDLTKAQKDLINGQATAADVNRAATALNEVRGQIRQMRSSMGWFKAFWWKLTQKFDATAFWQSQGLDLSTLAVRPKAADLVSSITGPTAEALKAALSAIDKNDWDSAQRAFQTAADVARTQKEALVAGQVAAGLRFDLSADNAFRAAAELAKSPGEAVEVAIEAAGFKNYKYRSAEFALRRAADISKTKEQALKVADRASSLGFVDAANYAAQKASQLG